MSIKIKNDYLVFDKKTEKLLALPLLIIICGSMYLSILSFNILFLIFSVPIILFSLYSLLRIGRRTYSKLYIISILIISITILVLGLIYLGNGIISNMNLECNAFGGGVENCAIGIPFIIGTIGATLAPPFSILALVAILSLKEIPKKF